MLGNQDGDILLWKLLLMCAESILQSNLLPLGLWLTMETELLTLWFSIAGQQ